MAAQAEHDGWSGRLEFELRTPRGWRTGLAEIIVRRDVVEVWTRRQLGVFERGELRRWLRTARTAPLAADEVVWTVVRGQFALQLGDSDPYPVPDDVTAKLIRCL